MKINIKRNIYLFTFFTLMFHSYVFGSSVLVAKNKKAFFPIVISQNASEMVRRTASDMKAYLEKMCGADFKIITGDGTSGIAIGVANDFPDLPFSKKLISKGVFDREKYIIKTHKNGVYLLGACDLAADEAVWDLFHKLGYRHYFAGKNWEIFPNLDEIKIDYDIKEEPDFSIRKITKVSCWEPDTENWYEWERHNRLSQAFKLNTRHIYQDIIEENIEVFKQHPEWFALWKGDRKYLGGITKFCLSNKELRKFVVNWAIDWFKKNPEEECISMDPSDTGHWCECNKCEAMGRVSDRVVVLANEVAEAINKNSEEPRYVGIYGYSFHALGPKNNKIHPNVLVSIATTLIKGGITLEQAEESWVKAGAKLGVRDYYSLWIWNMSLPTSKGLNSEKTLIEKTRGLYDRGYRFMSSAQSTIAFGHSGIYHWLVGICLWDVEECENIEKWKDDFYHNAFGAAKDIMREYYEYIDGKSQKELSDNLIGKMYQFLGKAKAETKDIGVKNRIDDLIYYTHYVELYRAMMEAPEGPERNSAALDLMSFVNKERENMVVPVYRMYQFLTRDKFGVTFPWDSRMPDENIRAKVKEEIPSEELDGYVKAAADKYEIVDFETKFYSPWLEPAFKKLKFKTQQSTVLFPKWNTGPTTIYTWMDEANQTIKLRAKTGMIYGDKFGGLKITVSRIYEDYLGFMAEEVVYKNNSPVPPDQKWYNLELKTGKPGFYKIHMDNNVTRFIVDFETVLPITLLAGSKHSMKLKTLEQNNNEFYFYVPSDTEELVIFASGKGEIKNGNGDVRIKIDKNQYYKIHLKKEERAQIWKISIRGIFKLLTVPPYVSTSPEGLLLPKEVIETETKTIFGQ